MAASTALEDVRSWLTGEVGTAARAALAASVGRAEAAQEYRDAQAAYAVSAEGCWWVSALDDGCRAAAAFGLNQYRALQDDDRNGLAVQGLMYARDRITHSMPLALDLEKPGPLLGGPGMIHLSRRFYWRPIADLCTPDDKYIRAHERAAYVSCVEGLSFHKPLILAARWFEYRAGNDPLG